ncbi:hypothetical protein [Microbispora bryophytorum]|uniref:Peptidase n=1 Tax=Microbispora bryophytorum TaxID=1460882 RepID=A0A8H9GZY5_9ACTN|nr:hypothetical protein [Microbispora bryophytorum]MBD3138734.1 hypothetical protein [Microbispora bryophytorum]TQS03750.1 hypothetical protein FLX07_24200 [Microbispora bryophytorum]GGO02348.1 hypothetical protein GCM10011574_11120 [Microbispora bryophytorum]
MPDRLIGWVAGVLLAVPGAGTAGAALAAVPGPSAVAAAAATDRGDPGQGLGIRLVDAPVARRADPRALKGVVDHLDPGTTIKRRIEVSNTSGHRMRVSLYPAAADIRGHAFVFAPDRTPNELTTWTSIAPAEIDLAPGQARRAWFTTRVPSAAWKGERYGVIWAQTTAEPDEAHNIGLASRVGIRMYLDIGPGGEPPSDMSIDRLTPERDATGRPVLAAQVHNTGGRALDLSGSLSLSDGPGGLRAGPYPAQLGVALRPGETGRLAVVMDARLPEGPWKVDMVVQSGLIKREVSATLVFPKAGIGRPATPSGASRLILPSIVVALGLVAAGVLTWRRRRAGSHPEPRRA